jgi:hypothetical protein
LGIYKRFGIKGIDPRRCGGGHRARERRVPFEARGEPKWEEWTPTPAVFVRVANKELTAYGKWKSEEERGHIYRLAQEDHATKQGHYIISPI